MPVRFHAVVNSTALAGVTATKGDRKTRFQALAVSLILLLLTLLKAFHFWKFTEFMKKLEKPIQYSVRSPIVLKNESFGACLIVKGDNDLLSEWIPYHYTLLPLRYLLAASDEGNPEDPNTVLQKWSKSNTDLKFWVVNVSIFENIHGEFNEIRTMNRYRKKKSYSKLNQSNSTIDHELQYLAHSRLIHKQKAMITYCTNFMKQRGISLVYLGDPDEFVTINHIAADEESEQNSSAVDETSSVHTTVDTKLLNEIYGLRMNLPPKEKNSTVIDIINLFHNIQQPLKSCHTMPRVSFGVLENFTCPGSAAVKEFAKENFGNDSLSTLKFQQHAVKEDFSKNRFGKVFIDLFNITDTVLSMEPSNIHRPFREECDRPVPVFKKSPFYLMHYAGGWKRFQSKGDKRRTIIQWKELAAVSDSTSCCQEEIYRWLPRFVDQVGLDRAKFLLRKVP